jgi:hypothetical protein
MMEGRRQCDTAVERWQRDHVAQSWLYQHFIRRDDVLLIHFSLQARLHAASSDCPIPYGDIFNMVEVMQ